MLCFMMKLNLMFFFLFFFNLMFNYVNKVFFMLIMMFIFIIMMMKSSFMVTGFYSIYGYLMMIDNYSKGLIMLSIWILFLMVMASIMLFKLKYFNDMFININILMLMILFLVFSVMNLFFFYILFEFSLIPMLLLIFGWGMQVERLQAGMYMLFYTLFSSLPLMLLIFFIYYEENTFMFDLMFLMKLFYFNNNFFFYHYFMMVFPFLVKLPMFIFHLWLPKAHVEAPVSGSMILAGVMLKLGSYGMLRLMLIFEKFCMYYNYIFMIWMLIGSFYISMICLIQVDLKMLVAYSSVVHMGIMMVGMMTLTKLGYLGGYFMMLSHGLCSSGLFCLVNFNYERLMSRSFFFNKGMMTLMPKMSLWWFLLCVMNMSSPPSLNLLSEIFLISVIINFSLMFLIFIMVICFLSAVYSLYLFSFTQHGKFKESNLMFLSSFMVEFLIVFLHWLPMNVIFLNLDFFV
uniref:NADH-ubiquinone oxidoreductase chain 4 n=1 Tax=Gasteruption parvicollarium TaxID=1738629 RepID=A0A2S0B5G6_9HYME|nr:NADH dehydrogenase subunit 4 [Gasteruption parvicollarium]ALJ93746.1 NADH dehydrogenase subunit 4 [Gasteruption parvicollarium]